MRFLELHLKAFGHFSGEVIDLNPPGDRNACLHLIVGANEAGKSTTLEAISRLMFGFPRGDERYGFEHAKSKLRVGAKIRRGDGSELTLWRSKTGNALALADGKTPAPESLFETILDSLTPETYWKLFGLNQEKLRSGGRELVQGRGDFSRILFGESLGEMESFSAVRQQLIEEASSLFKPGGKNAKSPLNQVKAERDKHRDELERATTTRVRWLELTTELDKTKAEIEKADAIVETHTKQAHRLVRLESSRESIEFLDLLNQRMDGFRDLPEISENVRLDFVRLRQDQSNLTETLKNSGLEIDRLEREIDSIVISEEIMAEGERIVELARAAVSAEELRSKSGSRSNELNIAAATIRERTLKLGFDPESPRGIPVCDDVLRARLNRSRQDLIELKDRIQLTERTIAVRLKEIEKDELELSQEFPSATADISALETAAARIEELLPRQARIESLRDRIGKLERQRLATLNSLPHWSGSWNQFASAKLPDFELVKLDADAVTSAWIQRESDEADLLRTRNHLEEKRSNLEIRLQQKQIPSPDELASTRSRRDREWLEIRNRWTAGAASSIPSGFAGVSDSDLADRFENDVRDSDRLADVLREHLETVELYWNCKQVESLIPGFESKLVQSESAWRVAHDRWSSHFAFLPSLPQRPDEMKAWPSTVENIRTLTEEIESDRAEIDRFETDWKALRDSIISPILRDIPVDDSSFVICRDKIQSLLDAAKQLSTKRELLEKQIRSNRTTLESQQSDLAADRTRLVAEIAAWEGSLAEAGMPAGLLPDSLDAFLSELAAVRQESTRHEFDRQQFETDSRRLKDFETRVTGLAQKMRFASSELDPVRLAEAMNLALTEQRKRYDRRRLAEKSLEIERNRHHETGTRLATIAQDITTICDTIGVEAPEDATDRLDAIAERNRLKAEIDNRISVLKAHAQGERLDRWCVEVRELDPERSAVIAAEFRGAIDKAKGERKELWNRRFEIESELKRIESGIESSEVLRAEESRKIFYDRTLDHMSRYLKCYLTSRVLNAAAEEYRRRMGQQVIELASQNFRALSLGSFDRVMTVTDDDSLRRLVAVRNDEDGTRLDLDHLSEGTRDQLFLALKLAMIQSRMVERASKGLEPLPVIFDDILVQFDDDRAAAAFRLLAELAGTTQVIYLTHHRHLAEIARSAVGPGSLSVHRLGTGEAGRTEIREVTPASKKPAKRQATAAFLEDPDEGH